MLDTMGRNIRYLRLSVTDLCNYRCRYCMGEEGMEKRAHSEILSVEECVEIARAAAACGVTKVRLTGGEPLMRRGILEICRGIAAIQGIEEVCMTTNGSRLCEYAKALFEAGVTRLNISLDTLQPDRFQEITRRGTLEGALAGVDAAKKAGFTKLKINTVLIGGFNTDEIPDFVALTKCGVDVRFIELMPIGECIGWPKSCFVEAKAVLEACPDLVRVDTQGVSVRYRIPGYAGTVGLIEPLSNSFCQFCDRIRVTADGMLKPCLHSGTEIPLRGLCGAALESAIRDGIRRKPPHHSLTEHGSDAGRNMNRIGG